MIIVKVVFFASFKEKLGASELEQSIKDNATIKCLCQTLADKGDQWQLLFANPTKQVKVACNQQMAEMSTRLKNGDQVAFFPPVTGG